MGGMLLVLLEHRARKMSRMDGRGAPMIFAAVFTVRCRVLQSAALQLPVPLPVVPFLGIGKLGLWARPMLPRVPPAEGGANERTYCHYILTGVARTP